LTCAWVPALRTPAISLPVLMFHALVAVLVVLGAWHRRHTERLRQEELAGARQLELLGRVTGGVAHDFNNLLFILLGAAESRIEQGDSSPELRQIVDTCQRGTSLVAQLTRPQDVSAHADLAALSRDLAPLLQALAGQRARVQIEADAGEILVAMSPAHLLQVLMNLVLNAGQAMPEGGTIRVVVRRSEQGARLAVIDEGVGIPAGVRARIFEPFFTTRSGGTGLGLSHVRLLVEQAGGTIHLDSTPGKGTTFSLDLPGPR
jgi:two-component system cell cycle sensor histidine kinase/response regulator CckA